MVRTTINLDPTVLEELRDYACAHETSLGGAASVLLARALKASEEGGPPRLKWHVTEGGSYVDLDDPAVLKEWAYGLRDVDHD
jgi:hypothetical protein